MIIYSITDPCVLEWSSISRDYFPQRSVYGSEVGMAPGELILVLESTLALYIFHKLSGFYWLRAKSRPLVKQVFE